MAVYGGPAVATSYHVVAGMLCGVPAVAGAVPEGAAVAAGPPHPPLHLPACLDCGVLQGTSLDIVKSDTKKIFRPSPMKKDRLCCLFC